MKKLLVGATVSVGLLAGGLAVSAPAQAAGPVYYGGGQSATYIQPCLAEQQRIAADRNYKIIKGCHFTSRPGGWDVMAYYFTYQARY
jgi:hypothetical protein